MRFIQSAAKFILKVPFLWTNHLSPVLIYQTLIGQLFLQLMEIVISGHNTRTILTTEQIRDVSSSSELWMQASLTIDIGFFKPWTPNLSQIHLIVQP